MQSVPRFLWGSFRVALKVALDEINAGHESRSILRQERGKKLLLLLPRMLLHRSRRGGLLSRDKLVARFDKFAAGHWHTLIHGGQLLCTRGSDRVPSESEEIQLAGL